MVLDKKKVIIILLPIIIFTLIALTLSQSELQPNTDGYRHYNKIIGECDSDWACEVYPNVYHSIAELFVSNEKDFLYFNIILFFIIFPIILFFITKNEFTPLIYFIGSSFSFQNILFGSYPSGFVMLFWLIFLKAKNSEKVLLLMLSLFIHNSGFFLLATTWLILYIIPKIQNMKIFPISFLPTFKFVNPLENFSYHLFGWLHLVFFPYALSAIFWLFKKKNYAYLFLLFYSFIASISISRAFYPFTLLVVIVFSDYFKEQKLEYKLVYLVLGVLFVFFFLSRFYLKV